MFNLQMVRAWIYLESSKTMLNGRNQAKPLDWFWVAWRCIPFAWAMILPVESLVACIVHSLTAITPNELTKPGMRITSWLWAAPLTTLCRYKDSQRHGRASFGKGKTCAPGSVFSSHFFHEKKVRQNLSTWDLVLKISMRGIQRRKQFEIWTHSLRDKTFWINRSTKKRENYPIATSGAHAARHLSQPGGVGVIFARSTP